MIPISCCELRRYAVIVYWLVGSRPLLIQRIEFLNPVAWQDGEIRIIMLLEAQARERALIDLRICGIFVSRKPIVKMVNHFRFVKWKHSHIPSMEYITGQSPIISIKLLASSE